MMGGALILGGDVDDLDDEDNGSLNIRAVFLDTAADAAAAAGVRSPAESSSPPAACSGLTRPLPSSSLSSWAITQCGCALSLLQPGANPLRRP